MNDAELGGNGAAFTVGENQQIGYAPLGGPKKEPLIAQWDAFVESVRTRTARPRPISSQAAGSPLPAD